MEFFTFDAVYLDNLRAGEVRTEEHFVRYFSELMQLKLRSRVRSREAMEDIRQEVFIRVLQLIRKDGIHQADRLGALVNTVCNHVLQEYYRSSSKAATGLEDESELMFADQGPSALSLLEVKDTERVVSQILAELPEKDRKLLRLVLLEERDKDEVCAELGVNREYLRVMIHRAKQSFKNYYVGRWGSGRPY